MIVDAQDIIMTEDRHEKRSRNQVNKRHRTRVRIPASRQHVGGVRYHFPGSMMYGNAMHGWAEGVDTDTTECVMIWYKHAR